ncbi:MAG: hypothetical protein IKF54_00185 [Eubacterium sp.]|nr:hypothetical protein [Eubacterium sp.]
MSKFEKNDVKTIVCMALFICLMTAMSVVTMMTAADCVYAAAKKANPLKVSGKTVKLKEDELEKKSQTIARKKVLTVKKAKGKVTYKIAKVTPAKCKKYFSMNKKTGNVTVKKGLKKGTYKIKAAVTAAGDKTYKKKTKKATFKVIVRAQKDDKSLDLRNLIDIYCAQTARDAYSDEDLEFFIDLIMYKLQPQAVEMLLDQYPCLRAAADQGQIGREIGMYFFYESGDMDGIPEHENAESGLMKTKDMAVVYGDDVKFKYMLAVDAGLLCKLDADQNPVRDNTTGKFVMEREGEKIELIKDYIAGEIMRALMLDYNRTGMIGATDIRNAVRNEDGKFPTQELEELYGKIVFPKWFTEGAAATVEDVFRIDREQFKLLRSEGNKDLLKNYVDSKNGFDLEKNVLIFDSESDPEFDPEKSCRVSGYLAVLYLAELSAMKTGKSSIDESGAVSAEKLCAGLNSILERMHDGETLDLVINDISPVDSGGKKIYGNTEAFEKLFVKGIKDGTGQYAGDRESIDFVNTLLDYLEKGENPSQGILSGGSILTDLKEGCSPLDGSRDSYSDFLQIVESNELVESTVPNSVALAGCGRSESSIDW